MPTIWDAKKEVGDCRELTVVLATWDTDKEHDACTDIDKEDGTCREFIGIPATWDTDKEESTGMPATWDTDEESGEHKQGCQVHHDNSFKEKGLKTKLFNFKKV